MPIIDLCEDLGFDNSQTKSISIDVILKITSATYARSGKQRVPTLGLVAPGPVRLLTPIVIRKRAISRL